MIVVPDGLQLAIEEQYAHRSGLRGIGDILADVLVTYELGTPEAESVEAGAANITQPASPARGNN